MIKIDSMIGDIHEELKLDKETYIFCVTGDHTTPCYLGDHTYHPVPIVIKVISENKKTPFIDRNERFNEIDCAKGILGRFSGSSLIPTLINIKNKINAQK